MRDHAHAACQRCRKSKMRCIGGPPCDNCVRVSQETCEFAHRSQRKKPVIQERPEDYGCRPCRRKNTLCKGGPPCENCVLNEEACVFGFESRRKENSVKMRAFACLPCSLQKIRCIGTEPPCGTCTKRGVESTCKFTQPSKRNPKTTATHTSYHESNHAAESPWKADPDSTLDENSDNRISPCTFTPLDTRPVHRSESPSGSKSLFTICSVVPSSELSQNPSLDVTNSDENDQATSLVGYTSCEDLLGILPGRQIIKSLIEKYFASISMVSWLINIVEISPLTIR